MAALLITRVLHCNAVPSCQGGQCASTALDGSEAWNSYPRLHSLSRLKFCAHIGQSDIRYPPPHQQLIHWVSASFFFLQKFGERVNKPAPCLHMRKPGTLIRETSFKGERHQRISWPPHPLTTPLQALQTPSACLAILQ